MSYDSSFLKFPDNSDDVSHGLVTCHLTGLPEVNTFFFTVADRGRPIDRCRLKLAYQYIYDLRNRRQKKVNFDHKKSIFLAQTNFGTKKIMIT